MFIKSKGQKSKSATGRLLEYYMRPAAVMCRKDGMPIVTKHNISGVTLEDFKRAFEANELTRRYTHARQNYLYSEYISYHPNDTKHLNVEIMEDLTRYYLEMRAPTGMGLAFYHDNTDARHAHILLSAIEIGSGKALRITKTEFETIKKEVQKYQLEKYPELNASVIDFEKEAEQSMTDEEYMMNKRSGVPSRKQELRNALQIAFDQSISKEEFYTNVQNQGLNVYERGGEIKGIDDGRHYRFITLIGEEKMSELTNREERIEALKESREPELKVELIQETAGQQENNLEVKQKE